MAQPCVGLRPGQGIKQNLKSDLLWYFFNHYGRVFYPEYFVVYHKLSYKFYKHLILAYI